MRLLSLFFAALMLLPATGARAQHNPVVLELFTSQGCSSCPPADALLAELSRQPGILALSLPVEYWDYLGWKDTLAMPAFTRRQKTYAKNLNLRSVYTPQMIIDGVTDAVGSRRAHIERAVQLRTDMLGGSRVPIRFNEQGNAVEIHIGEGEKTNTETTLWLVRFNKQTQVEINRGENAGKTITYTNVVRDMSPIGMWNGAAQTYRLSKMSLSAQGYDGCAVILQKHDAGPILGAAELDLDLWN